MKIAPIRRLSASGIARFQTCPKQFCLQDIEREKGDQAVTGVLVQANAIHHALERFFGLPLGDRSPENLVVALRAVWSQHRRRGAFADADEEAQFGLEAVQMLRRFADGFALDAGPLAREQWLSGRTPSGVELFGKLDRVDERGDGLSIIDYKTGRQMLEVEDLRSEPAVWCYLMLAEAAYQRPVEQIRFIYLRHGLETCWEIERDDAQALKERLAAQIKTIREETQFPAAPGPHCRFCPFALRCPERTQVSLEELVPVEGLPF